MRVITYRSPGGGEIDLTEDQVSALEALGKWPRDASGEYCEVSRGLHLGIPLWGSVEAVLAYTNDPGAARRAFLRALAEEGDKS